jgi:hypothetical protein
MSFSEEGDFSPSFCFFDFIAISPSLDKQRKYRMIYALPSMVKIFNKLMLKLLQPLVVQYGIGGGIWNLFLRNYSRTSETYGHTSGSYGRSAGKTQSN